AGESTGYASNRALVFQQLPTAGLPWPLQNWAEYESYLDDMAATGVMADATEVRWDVRPAPRWGTVEVRACDGMSTLPELAAVTALVQVLVEHFSRELDAGRELPILQPWFIRENKWRAARYGMDARLIVDRAGTQVPVAEHLRETIDRLADVAAELKCAREFAGVDAIVSGGASYARQLTVAEAAGGDLREVVQHLIREFRNGPTLRDHLLSLAR
ncbi:glutamate-cysteine ligase family protein, partial [Microbacterium sp. zg.Y909]|uniref:glutamate-cysteine ligase family protein n=1 Tax=Microbacterium sp. zg.Y909 TaxID=2969413 RepID=UPI00214CF23C